jgi:uncharacterized protein (TIGR01777 family)
MVPVDNRAKVVIAGGSGFIGVSLALDFAAAGWRVVILSRRAPKVQGPWAHVGWDARTVGDWRQQLEGATGLVNLVGRNVDCIKTPDHQDEILRSRVEATRVLGRAMRSIDTPPPVWVQMSTARIYGDPPEVTCDEDSPFGAGFAPFVAQAWETELQRSVLPSRRSVVLRTSFVIGRDRGAGSGALARLRPLARLGLGGTVASGTQGISWIHETDVNRLFEHALTNATMQGIYIATSPNPVSERIFMRELSRAVGMPLGLPSPTWLIRCVVPLVLRTDPELALYGRYVVSKRLKEEGFEFRFPDLRAALTDVVESGPPKSRPNHDPLPTTHDSLPTMAANRGGRCLHVAPTAQ